MKELVSIIIPAYNSEQYITRSVDSALNQSYENIEVLVVNDGSTDGTGEIVEQLKLCSPKIKYFYKDNGGLSDARNYGIKKAGGEYLCFLDSDDTFEPQFVEAMVDAVKRFHVSLAVCGYSLKYEDGSKIDSKVYGEACRLNREQVIAALICGEYLSSHAWNKLYKKEVFESIEFPVGKYYEDIFVTTQMADQCTAGFAFVNDHLVNYYQIESSITHQQRIPIEFDAFEATYHRFIKYREEYDELFSYLVKEPICIAVRLKLMKFQNEEEKAYYFDREPYLNGFLHQMYTDIRAYKKLDLKYKAALAFHRLIKRRI